MRYSKYLLAPVLAFALAGCSLWDSKEPDYPEQVLYEKATTALDNSLWDESAKWYEKLEARYPFGRYSEQAQLELMYAYYKQGKVAATQAAADRFIRLFPNSDYVDYAYYLRGLTAFEEDQSIIDRFLPTDESRRDAGAAKASYDDFATLVRLYPDSPYAADARNRMVYLRNRLAKYEIHVARFYMKRGAFLAAANRGRYVVENFQESTSVPDGLAMMIAAYTALGSTDLANSAQQVLDLNYPGYEKDVLDDSTVFDRYTLGVFQKGDARPDLPSRVKAGTSLPAQESDASQSSGAKPWYHRATFGIFE
ncbi:outer membrane protein assembly factor BamD [Balneatrix alpica]|uniref:Outer membrane protein assembly factor BamD n=1 Tax=Balneatrix alpica TaxID=75684 RepID=A0ABV5ZBZ6_9GAMM|nr:outer membrane protein assembly factor BamD [Balneatrix alpica]